MSQKLGNKTNRNFYIRPSTNQNLRRAQLNSQSQPMRKENQNSQGNNDFVMFHIQGFGNLNNNNQISQKNTKRGGNNQNGASNEMQQKIQKIYGYEPPKTSQKLQHVKDQQQTQSQQQGGEHINNQELKFYRAKYKIPTNKFEKEDSFNRDEIQHDKDVNDVSEIRQQFSDDSMFDLQDLMVSGLDIGVSKIESTGITSNKIIKSQKELQEEKLLKKNNKYYFNQQLQQPNQQQSGKLQNNFTSSIGGQESMRKTLSLYQQKKKQNSIQLQRSQQQGGKSKQMSQDMQKFNLKYQDFMNTVDNEYMQQFPNNNKNNLQQNGSSAQKSNGNSQIQTLYTQQMQQSQQSSRFGNGVQQNKIINNKFPFNSNVNLTKNQRNSWNQKNRNQYNQIGSNEELGIVGNNKEKQAFKATNYGKLNQNKQEQWKNNIQSQFRQHRYIEDNKNKEQGLTGVGIGKGSMVNGFKTQGNFFNNGSGIKQKKFAQQQLYQFE